MFSQLYKISEFKDLTSVRQWIKRKITEYSFLDADFGIADAKYNGKENEN